KDRQNGKGLFMCWGFLGLYLFIGVRTHVFDNIILCLWDMKISGCAGFLALIDGFSSTDWLG
ncbi:hypothetical protein ACJX0J_018929, partial [Zea mays]